MRFTKAFYVTVLTSIVNIIPSVATNTGTAAECDESQARQMDWTRVDKLLGRTGAAMADEVHRYGFPRSDLSVNLRGVRLNAGFALGGYAAFKTYGNTSMAVGDLVLTEDEINPTIAALQRGGIQETALHNHLLFESPHVMYLHFRALGDPVEIATALRTALSSTKTPLTAPPGGSPGPLALEVTQLDKIMGLPGKANNGFYQYSVGRAETIRDGNMVIPSALGVSTVINFQPTGDGKAAITGDFAMTSKEVPLVVRTLSAQGISITAMHSHMVTDSPHLFYMHFWANENAIRLAQGLRAAINHINMAKPRA